MCTCSGVDEGERQHARSVRGSTEVEDLHGQCSCASILISGCQLPLNGFLQQVQLPKFLPKMKRLPLLRELQPAAAAAAAVATK